MDGDVHFIINKDYLFLALDWNIQKDSHWSRLHDVFYRTQTSMFSCAFQSNLADDFLQSNLISSHQWKTLHWIPNKDGRYPIIKPRFKSNRNNCFFLSLRLSILIIYMYVCVKFFSQYIYLFIRTNDMYSSCVNNVVVKILISNEGSN